MHCPKARLAGHRGRAGVTRRPGLQRPPLLAAGAEPAAIERWFAEDRDVRSDSGIGLQISAFIARHGVKSVVMADRILGCPHEEGVGYPEAQVCPQCPFWAHRDRWTGDMIR